MCTVQAFRRKGEIGRGAADIARIAEPFFLRFNAECRFRIAMTPKELEKAGLETLGKKWS